MAFSNILRVFILLLPLLCCPLSHSLGKYLPILFFLISISLLFIFVMLWIELRASHILNQLYPRSFIVH